MARGTARCGILGFPGGDRDNFSANVAVNDEHQRHPHALPAVREKSAVRGEIARANRRMTDAEQHRRAEDDEQDDRDHLDHREPVFKRAEAAHAARVHPQQSRGESHDPQPRRNIGEPPAAVDRDRGGFASDGDRLHRPVGVAHHEAGPASEVNFGMDTERPGGGMRHRHLRERAHQQQRDGRAEHEGEDHGRAGQAHGERAAEEQPGADGAADRDHRQLWRRELAVQASFLVDYGGGKVGE